MPFPLRDDADSTYGFARDAAIWWRRIPLRGNDGRRFRHFPKKRDDGYHESGFEYETGERCTANRGYPGARDSDGHRNGWSGKQQLSRYVPGDVSRDGTFEAEGEGCRGGSCGGGSQDGVCERGTLHGTFEL